MDADESPQPCLPAFPERVSRATPLAGSPDEQSQWLGAQARGGARGGVALACGDHPFSGSVQMHRALTGIEHCNH